MHDAGDAPRADEAEDSAGAARRTFSLATLVIALLAAGLLGAGTAFLVFAPKSPRAAPGPAPTPTAKPLDLPADRLAGVWVGSARGETLVLSITPRPHLEDRVECALNAGTRELIAFEAVVERGRGLTARSLPGLELRFGAAREDAAGRLHIPLVDDDGRERGRLSQTRARATPPEDLR